MQWQKSLTSGRTTITALIEQHNGILSKGTNFYLGIGPHMGNYGTVGKVNGSVTMFGISGIGGMEFKFGRTILSADIKPAINLFGGNSVLETRTGISLRYVFIKALKKEHKWMFWKRKKNEKRNKENQIE